MTVGRVYSTTTTHLSGITEVLLERAQRELEEVRGEKEKWGLSFEKMQRERDHYKQALEEISSSVDDWLNSLIQEPSLDFIHAIKAYAQKKLNEI